MGNTSNTKGGITMKINFNGYEVEIKAKHIGERRCSKESAMYVLNQITLWVINAEKYYNMEGYNALAKNAKESSDEIYRTLKANGFYER